MITKVVAFVTVMVSLCSYIAFSDSNGTEKIFKAFASMYAPSNCAEPNKNIMCFDSEQNPADTNVPMNTIAEANMNNSAQGDVLINSIGTTIYK